MLAAGVGSNSLPTPWVAPTSVARKSNPGLSLNLASLKPDENSPSELQMRREKFSHFERHCSQVRRESF